MAPPCFRETFKTAEQALRLIGAYPDIPRDLFWFLKYVIMNMVAGTLFSWLLNSIINHDVPKGDYGEACKNGTMVIVYIVVNTKYWILMSHQHALAGLLARIDNDPRRETYTPEEEAAVTMYAHKKGVFVCKLWIAVAFSIPMLLVLHAVVEMCWLAYRGDFHLVPMYDLTYPDFINELKYKPLVYAANFIHCMLYAAFVVAGYIGFDPLAPCLMLHACGQLEVVRLRIGKLFPASGFDLKETQRKLGDIVTHLQDIYWTVDETREIFVLMFEIVMTFNTLLVPFTAVQIMQTLKNNPSEIPVEFIIFEFGCFIHFYVPCYYSDLLLQKSNEVREALYACGWERRWAGKDVRRRLLLVLCRTTKPLALRTVFQDVSLQAFAEMCQNGYLIFNLINLMSK